MQQEREVAGATTAGTVALWAGRGSERVAGSLGEGKQATEGRMQARSSRGGRREKPDQGAASTRAKLETTLKSERESGGKKLR